MGRQADVLAHRPVDSPPTRRNPTADPATSLTNLWRISKFEEALEDLFGRGMLHRTMHVSIGQEAVAEGTCAALRHGDLITSTHRSHGHALAHGADPARMMAELLMKEIKEWRDERNPIARFQQWATSQRILDQADVQRCEQQTTADKRNAVASAVEQPDTTGHDLVESVYA